MITTIIIATLIAAYSVFLIVRGIKKHKLAKETGTAPCCCGCSGGKSCNCDK